MQTSTFLLCLGAAAVGAGAADAVDGKPLDLEGALDGDDVCADADQACALNAIQLRGRKTLVAEGQLTHPLFCQGLSEAAAPVCAGRSVCSCAAHCTAGVSPRDWGFDVSCCACEGAAEAAGVLQVSGKQGLSDGEDPLSGACSCAEECRQLGEAERVSRASCCGCSASLLEALAKATAGRQVPAVGLNHPLYCKTVQPGIIASCNGARSCQCTFYCPTASPTSYPWDPNCCGCAGAEQSAAPVVTAPVVPPPQVVAAPGWRPLAKPLYCQAVPVGWPQPATCVGLGPTCTCQFYCRTSSPTSYGWDPQCCGCNAYGSLPAAHVAAAAAAPVAAAAAAAAAANPALKVAAEGVESSCSANPGCSGLAGECCPASNGKMLSCCEQKVASLAAVNSTTTRKGLDQPIYCQLIPAGSPLPAVCEKGKKTCLSCAAYCHSGVPATWGWDAGCCGCDGADQTKLPPPPAVR